MLTMKKVILLFTFTTVCLGKYIYSQDQVDSVQFFVDQSVVEVTLETDLKDLLGKRQRDRYLPATITMTLDNNPSITEGIQLSVRGNFRRENCYMPGLRLDFHNPTSPRLYKLDKLKLTCGCSSGSENEQLVLREFMAYKIYTLLTDKSLRVRLAHVTFTDARGKKKPYTQYAFFIEDIDNMAKRNGMKELEEVTIFQEMTDRDHTTLVSLFEYFLGCTDWAIPNYHNIKLIYDKKDNTARPFVVPYDFDISGFVDAPYSTIDPMFEDKIQTVRDRLYRGFPRSMEELKAAIAIFNAKKDAIFKLVSDFPYFDKRSSSWLTRYIEEFYKTIDNDRDVQRFFIDEARDH